MGRLPPSALAPQEELRTAAFAVVGGLPRIEAMRLLEADGFLCNGGVCRLREATRETIWGRLGPIRPPGPARCWLWDYEVRLTEDPVMSPAGIEAATDRVATVPAADC